MPRGRKSRRRRNARAAEENRNSRKIQASETSETPMAASVGSSTPEDDLSCPEEDPNTPEETSTTPEESLSIAQAQKPSVARSNFQGTKKSLLMSILALIFIMGNSAKEALVWKVLGKLGMQPGQQHSIFGDPKKVVTEEFVRRGYLIYKPVPRSSPVEYEFFWGPRAHVESSKLKVMHFVARVRNRCSKDWPCNYDWDSDDDAEVEAILNSGWTQFSISAVGTKVEMRKPWKNWWDASFLPCQVTFLFHCTAIVYRFIVKRNHQPEVMFVAFGHQMVDANPAAVLSFLS